MALRWLIGATAFAGDSAAAAAAASHKPLRWLLRDVLVLLRGGDQRWRGAGASQPLLWGRQLDAGHGIASCGPGPNERTSHGMRLRFRIQCSSAVGVARASHQYQSLR
ncbi:hypothetical protein VPH35_060443 [Triticum aestivum]